MTTERMSEERFVFVRECIESDLKTSILVHGAPDRQFDSFKVNKELLAEIDALRAELTAARTVADGEVGRVVTGLWRIQSQTTTGSLFHLAAGDAADLLTRLSAAKAEAERNATQAFQAGVAHQERANAAERERDEALAALAQAREALVTIAQGGEPDDPQLTSQSSEGNYDDVFYDGMRQADYNNALVARQALASLTPPRIGEQ